MDIRFVDTKTEEADDHPWRMRYVLSPSDFQTDNEWHHIQIPLSSFSESGSWDNEWFNPEGKFDWKAIDVFEITSEYEAFNGSEFWFDEIKIVDPNAVSVDEQVTLNNEFKLLQNYPNPFNPTTTIEYAVSASPQTSHYGREGVRQGFVSLKVYDILGREVSVLVNEEKAPGIYKVQFDASKLSSGVYFYQLKSGGAVINKKMILLK